MKDISELIEQSMEYITNDKEHPSMTIDYILLNNVDISKSKVVASNNEDMVSISIEDRNLLVWNVPDWDYNFDDYIFKELEDGCTIQCMTVDMHYNLWCDIHEFYPDDIEHKRGMMKYLEYCRKIGITKSVIDSENNLDVPNTGEIVYNEQRVANAINKDKER